MKVDINKNVSKEGLVFKKEIFEILVTVKLTDEERSAYKLIKKDVDQLVLIEYIYKETELNTTCGTIIYNNDKNSSMRYVVYSQFEVAPMEEKILDGLKIFSNLIKAAILIHVN